MPVTAGSGALSPTGHHHGDGGLEAGGIASAHGSNAVLDAGVGNGGMMTPASGVGSMDNNNNNNGGLRGGYNLFGGQGGDGLGLGLDVAQAAAAQQLAVAQAQAAAAQQLALAQHGSGALSGEHSQCCEFLPFVCSRLWLLWVIVERRSSWRVAGLLRHLCDDFT